MDSIRWQQTTTGRLLTVSEPIDFWFDFSCPYAYVASTRLTWLAEETNRSIRLKPFLLGGVFRALQQPQNMSTTLNAPKAHHNRLDLMRWADWYEVPLRTPFRHPNRSVEALRAFLCCPSARQAEVMAAFYRLYWAEQRDLSSREELGACLDRLGLDGFAVLQRIDHAQTKNELIERTDEAIELGVFGAPTFVVDGSLFWGQDRLDMVAATAKGWRPPSESRDFKF